MFEIEAKSQKNKSMKGVYKHGKKWRVRKYNCHIGVYNTYDEAVESAKIEEIAQLKFKYTKQYFEAKKWLQENGILP